SAFPRSTRLVPALYARLPFRATGAQDRAFAEIEADLAAPHPMRRLLQGDVGSGKTLVALLAALTVIEAGHQVALMAPTELLAEQHLETVRPLAEPLGVDVALLTGAVKGRARREALAGLATGRIAPRRGLCARARGGCRGSSGLHRLSARRGVREILAPRRLDDGARARRRPAERPPARPGSRADEARGEGPRHATVQDARLRRAR